MKDLPDDLTPYFWRRNELTIEFILWDLRVVIPQKFRERLLNEIRDEGHPSICRMKTLARFYLWWPQLAKTIETKVKLCKVCAAVQNSPPGIGHPIYGSVSTLVCPEGKQYFPI